MQQNDVVEKIVSINKKLAQFWNEAHGWAPQISADILSKSRLDWQVSLSKTLNIWVTPHNEAMTNGQLILAWVNLGALVEGSMKLLLIVYYEDFVEDGQAIKKSGAYDKKRNKIKNPDGLTFDNLKRFFYEKELVNKEEYTFLELVQTRRNAIHAFKDRGLGDKKEFQKSVVDYYHFLENIDTRLPYPDD